ALDVVNEKLHLDWKKAQQETSEAFLRACREATDTGLFSAGDPSCGEPMALFRKAFDNLDLDVLGEAVDKHIADGAAALPRFACAPNSESHSILKQAATAACDSLAAQLDEIESASSPQVARLLAA